MILDSFRRIVRRRVRRPAASLSPVEELGYRFRSVADRRAEYRVGREPSSNFDAHARFPSNIEMFHRMMSRRHFQDDGLRRSEPTPNGYRNLIYQKLPLELGHFASFNVATSSKLSSPLPRARRRMPSRTVSIASFQEGQLGFRW